MTGLQARVLAPRQLPEAERPGLAAALEGVATCGHFAFNRGHWFLISDSRQKGERINFFYFRSPSSG